MTQEEKTNLTKLNNLELIEELLKYQHDVDRYHELRASVDYHNDMWLTYHDKLYESSQNVIEVKYMIVRRMKGGCSGYGTENI